MKMYTVVYFFPDTVYTRSVWHVVICSAEGIRPWTTITQRAENTVRVTAVATATCLRHQRRESGSTRDDNSSAFTTSASDVNNVRRSSADLFTIPALNFPRRRRSRRSSIRPRVLTACVDTCSASLSRSSSSSTGTYAAPTDTIRPQRISRHKATCCRTPPHCRLGVDIAVITETHSKNKHDDHCAAISGYSLFRRDRQRQLIIYGYWTAQWFHV